MFSLTSLSSCVSVDEARATPPAADAAMSEAKRRKLDDELARLRRAVDTIEDRVCAPLGDAKFTGSHSEQMLRVKYHALLLRVQMAENAETRVCRGSVPDECPICRSDLDKRCSTVSQLLPCRHLFCTECLKRIDENRREERDKEEALFVRRREAMSIISRAHWRQCPICRAPAPFDRTVLRGAPILPLTLVARAEMDAFSKEFSARHPYMSWAAAARQTGRV